MPTLPLYTPNAVADASHDVVAPGGYEAWHFDAESEGGDVRLAAMVGQGCPFHAEYLRRYVQYRRRPTHRPPPLPAEYPWAHFAVYERGRMLGRFTTYCPPEQFAASAARPGARAGGNEFVREQDGTLPLRLSSVPAPAGEARPGVSARLTFRPTQSHRAYEAAVLRRSDAGDDHRWVIADPLCDVSGTITLGPEEPPRGHSDGNRPRVIEFRGRGYHDHTYGTGPLLAGMRYGMRGRLILSDRVVAFYIAQPLHRHLPTVVRLVESGPTGVRELAVSHAPTVRWQRISGRTRYPHEVHVPGAVFELRLTAPTILESTGMCSRLVYSCATGHQVGQALCEVWAAPRLAWALPIRPVGLAAGRAEGPAVEGL